MVAVKLIKGEDVANNLPFPLQKPTTIHLLVTQDITFPTLVKAAKYVVRMITGTTKKLIVSLSEPSSLRTRVFPENALPRDVKMREFTMTIGVRNEVKMSIVAKLPTIKNLKPDLEKDAVPIARAWEKLSLIVRN